MGRRNFLGLGSSAAAGGALPACAVGTAARAADRLPAQPGRVRGWNQLAVQAIRATHPAPLAGTHSLAILHTCMYNAWAAYDDQARQTVHGVAVRLPRGERGAASKASAMSHAAWRALCSQFPSQQSAFDARLAGLGLAPAQGADPLTPAGIGRTQAASVLSFHCRDGAAQTGDPGACSFTPFAPGPGGQSGLARAALSGERACEAAPARWWRLAHCVSERDAHDDDRDVLLYFVLANALGDAAIAAASCPGPVSGDSVLAAAAAEVLRSFTGSDRLGSGAMTPAPGPVPAEVAPAWASFSEAAEQAGRPGQRIGADATHAAGLELGRQVGAQVFDKARRYWQGKL